MGIAIASKTLGKTANKVGLNINTSEDRRNETRRLLCVDLLQIKRLTF